MIDFSIKSNDTVPIKVQLRRDGSSVDLSSADVRFLMQSADSGELVVDAAAAIDDAANGEVSYHWSDTDTAEDGHYHIEWEVTFNPGTVDEYVETFPRGDYMTARIIEDLG